MEKMKEVPQDIITQQSIDNGSWAEANPDNNPPP
jgi:hypothetical protein